MRLLVVDDAAVGRDGDFTIGEGIKRIDGLVTRNARHQMNDNLSMVAGEVIETLNLDLTLFDCLSYRLDERIGGFTKRHIGDTQRLLVDLVDATTYLDDAATSTIVIFRNVDEATRREVGVKLKRFAFETGNRRIEQFVEVMRQDLRRKTHSNTLHALGEEQRELDGKVDRLLLATIVGKLPRCDLIIEHHLEREFRKASLDVTWCGCRIAREDIAPVALTVDEQFLLSQLHQGIADAGIAMRMVLHGLSNDVSHLVVAAIIDYLHGMQDATLHRLQSVGQVRHGTLQDDVTRIVEEPVLVHAAQMVYLVIRGIVIIMGLVAIACSRCLF